MGLDRDEADELAKQMWLMQTGHTLVTTVNTHTMVPHLLSQEIMTLNPWLSNYECPWLLLMLLDS